MRMDDLKKVIEKELRKYSTKEIKIRDRSYLLYIIPEFCDEYINIFEGFLFIETKDKDEISYLKSRYTPPLSGYVPRLGIILYDGHLLIKDYRQNRHIIKTLKKINESFLNKFKKALSEPRENINKLFDRKDIIEEFYILYKKSREYLLKNISGISEEEKREEFVDNFMMQMLTLWYLQERSFFNNDRNYFITKFKEFQKKLFNDFQNYYEFLVYLFEKISGYTDGQYVEDSKIGKVVIIGPAVFLNGECSKAISIPDKCFYKEGMTDTLINTPPGNIGQEIPLLNLFESRDWVEGDIDEYVLGSLYEKLMTEDKRRRTGAYYTPEKITSYICKNTIEPYLVDKLNERFNRDFETIDQIIESNEREILLYLFELLKEIKILDPAVGSAHFLESAINILVDIYEKVWKKAKELGIRRGFEIIAADEKGEVRNINLLEVSNEERFKLLIKFFIILSKNIYGVDINSSALKMAKARLFLTLAKHFKIGKEKDIFIRFPNVHFNLREGNSLIGYIDLGKDKENKQPSLFDFDVNEGSTEYIAKRINIISELKPYLERVSKALGINCSNIVKEVESLNMILVKKEISWEDFEKVLKTKEKLIRILIASLNSEYAKPLHELLEKLTDLFNQKLDEKFANEYKIDLEKLNNSKSMPWKRKMFHWIFEFPEVFFYKDGFDVIIGNPPYGRLKQIIENTEERHFLSNVYSKLYKYQVGNLNLYKLFLERSFVLLQERSYFSMIFPSSFLGENDSKKLRNLLFEQCMVNKILEFPEKTRVFEGNTQAVCILFYKKVKKIDYTIKIKTNITRDEKDNLTSLDFLIVRKSDLKELTGEDYRIPLFYNPKIEWEILKHISKYPPFKGNDKIPPIGEIGVGHVDETFDKEFMSDEPGDDLLIKGIHLDRYFVNLDPNGPTPRWIVNKEKFFERKPGAKKVAEQGKIIGRNTINRASKPRLRFAPLSKGYVITNAIKFIIDIDEDIEPYFLISMLNSTLLNWRFELFSLQNNIRNYEIKSLPILRISREEQRPFIILVKYMLFLKQYQNHFAKDDKHLQYIIDYFDNLIDCLVYELYLGEIIRVPVKQFVENKLVDIDLPENLLKTEEKKRKEILQKVEKVFNELKSDKKLSENLHLIKSHLWVKTICESLER